MDIANRSSINFQANVSQSVFNLLQEQLKHCSSRKKCTAMVNKQIENIKSWGSPDSDIVFAKDIEGNYSLGVMCTVAPGLKLPWAIRNLKARTELSKFLSLKKSNIEQTEDSVRFLYKRYGEGLFSKHQEL